MRQYIFSFSSFSFFSFFTARRVGRQTQKRPNIITMLGREKDFIFLSTLKHSPGKSKRENRENNEHLVPRTFTLNKDVQNDKTRTFQKNLRRELYVDKITKFGIDLRFQIER